MGNSGNIKEKWSAFVSSVRKEAVAVQTDESMTGWQKAQKILRIIGKVIYHLRKIFMAIPVICYALKLAAYNAANLPETVGLNIQANGTFAETVSRATAINGPLIVTAACLALMFLSRKTVYPWIISIFSLIIPIMLLVTNLYPC